MFGVITCVSGSVSPAMRVKSIASSCRWKCLFNAEEMLQVRCEARCTLQPSLDPVFDPRLAAGVYCFSIKFALEFTLTVSPPAYWLSKWSVQSISQGSFSHKIEPSPQIFYLIPLPIKFYCRSQ